MSAKKAPQKSVNKLAIETEEDILKVLKEDHKPLKALLKTLKNPDISFSKRQAAFAEFASLLNAHAKPEEKTLYVYMKVTDELRQGGMEGDVEHALADQLVKDLKGIEEEDLWSAKAKVLAELVEHHIEEEEKEIFPAFKKESDADERIALGIEYNELRSRYFEGEDSDKAGRSPAVVASLH